MSPAVPGRPSRWAVAAAFAAIYLIWGSTYLAIRYAVQTIPPLMMAGARFMTAGVLLYAVVHWRGAPRPQFRHWRSAAVVGGLLLLGGNGLVSCAEQWVASGITALLVATVPLWMVLLNWVRPGGLRPTAVQALGLLVGFVGVAVLIEPWNRTAESTDWVGAVMLLIASALWACGSIYSRHCPLPPSALQATAMEMLAGGAMLLVAGLVVGEGARLAPGAIALNSGLAFGYLVVFGSLVGFSAYIWILQVSTPARASTYAYVNPTVAVLLGWAIAGEPIGGSTLTAMGIIVVAVVMITRPGRPVPAVDLPAAAAADPPETDRRMAAPLAPCRME